MGKADDVLKEPLMKQSVLYHYIIKEPCCQAGQKPDLGPHPWRGVAGNLFNKILRITVERFADQKRFIYLQAGEAAPALLQSFKRLHRYPGHHRQLLSRAAERLAFFHQLCHSVPP